jgi:hypothetical protein
MARKLALAIALSAALTACGQVDRAPQVSTAPTTRRPLCTIVIGTGGRRGFVTVPCPTAHRMIKDHSPRVAR